MVKYTLGDSVIVGSNNATDNLPDYEQVIDQSLPFAEKQFIYPAIADYGFRYNEGTSAVLGSGVSFNRVVLDPYKIALVDPGSKWIPPSVSIEIPHFLNGINVWRSYFAFGLRMQMETSLTGSRTMAILASFFLNVKGSESPESYDVELWRRSLLPTPAIPFDIDIETQLLSVDLEKHLADAVRLFATKASPLEIDAPSARVFLNFALHQDSSQALEIYSGSMWFKRKGDLI